MNAAVFLRRDYSEILHSIKRIKVRDQLQRNCSTWLKNWFKNKDWKSREKLSLVNDEKEINSRWQKFMNSQILCCVLGKSVSSLSPTKNGEPNWIGLRTLSNTDNCIESMESRWNSSGWFSQDSLRCRFSTKSKNLWKPWDVNQKDSRKGLSSCRCTTTSYGEIRITNKYVSPIPPLYLNMQRRSLQVIGHSSDQDRNEMECDRDTFKPRGEWDGVAELMRVNLSESGHPISCDRRIGTRNFEN